MKMYKKKKAIHCDFYKQDIVSVDYSWKSNLPL